MDRFGSKAPAVGQDRVPDREGKGDEERDVNHDIQLHLRFNQPSEEAVIINDKASTLLKAANDVKVTFQQKKIEL